MIKHIVLWRLKDQAEGADSAENAKKIVQALSTLKSKISEIVELEAGINYNETAAAFDVALYSVFKTKQDLEIYQKHPEHVNVAQMVSKRVAERAVVDYEI